MAVRHSAQLCGGAGGRRHGACRYGRRGRGCRRTTARRERCRRVGMTLVSQDAGEVVVARDAGARHARVERLERVERGELGQPGVAELAEVGHRVAGVGRQQLLVRRGPRDCWTRTRIPRCVALPAARLHRIAGMRADVRARTAVERGAREAADRLRRRRDARRLPARQHLGPRVRRARRARAARRARRASPASTRDDYFAGIWDTNVIDGDAATACPGTSTRGALLSAAICCAQAGYRRAAARPGTSGARAMAR